MKVLIIQTAFLGDLILTLPLAQEIKSRYPEAEITLLVIPGNKEIAQACPAVDKVITFDKRGEQKSLPGLFRLGAGLRKIKYDVVYSPHRSFRSALLAFLSRPNKSIGFDKSAGAFFFKKKIVYNSKIHEVERNLSLLGNFSGGRWRIFPEIDSSPARAKVHSETGSDGSVNLIAIAPGSVWETKKYPLESFSEIGMKLAEKGFRIIVIGGPEDKRLGDELAESIPGAKNYCGKFSVLESTELLRQCSLLISNDSAPTHLAIAAGIPAITIYCSTIPGFGFYPYNPQSVSLSYDELDCKPCGIHGKTECPVKTFDCAKKLRPSRVLDAAENLFSNLS